MGSVANQLATLSQLQSFVGSEQAQLHSNLSLRHVADTCEVSSRGKSAGLVVVAVVNGRGEVIAVRDTQKNDGPDVGSMV